MYYKIFLPRNTFLHHCYVIKLHSYVYNVITLYFFLTGAEVEIVLNIGAYVMEFSKIVKRVKTKT